MIQWFANRTIRQKLVLGFGTLIALVVLLAAVTVRNNVAVQANYEALADDSFPVVHSLGEADLQGRPRRRIDAASSCRCCWSSTAARRWPAAPARPTRRP